MPYTVTQGVFVDGSIADAKDFLDEFGKVASELSSMERDHKTAIATALSDAHKHTDDSLSDLVVDGGAY